MSQPAVAAGWSSQRWMDFSKKMASHVRSFKKDGYAVLGQLLIPVGIIIIIIELASPLGEVVKFFLAFVVTYGLSTWMRNAPTRPSTPKSRRYAASFRTPRCSFSTSPAAPVLASARTSFLPISQ